jgi:hypothetical protein
VNQLDKETNETHDEKANSNSPSDSGELFAVGLGALLDQMHRVLGKLPERLNEHLVESLLICHFYLFIELNEY